MDKVLKYLQRHIYENIEMAYDCILFEVDQHSLEK